MRLAPVRNLGSARVLRTAADVVDLREDRILQEIHATGGDIRRICDLFGLSIEAALRYAATLGHPDLAGSRAASSRTPDGM